MTPSSGVGGRRPTPTNPIVASDSTAVAAPKVISVSNGASSGSRCRFRM